MSDVVVLQQGDDDDVTLPFPEALPGMTASAKVRAYPTGPVLHEWKSLDGSLIVGTAQVTLVVVDSATWTWRSGEFDIRLDTGLQTEVAGPWKVRVRTLLSGGDPGTGGGSSDLLIAAHNTSSTAHPDIRALIADGGGSGEDTATPDATPTTKGKSVILAGTADNPLVPYNKVTGTPTSMPPSGGAGGVLSGNFPNPGFAVDMTTQSEHYAHVNDLGNPHGTSKAQVGLGNVANLAPADMPLSNAVADAIGEVESAVPQLAAQAIAAAISSHNTDPAAHIDMRALLAGDGPGAATRLTGIPTAITALSGHRVVTPSIDGRVGYASNTNPAHTHVPLWITLTAAVPDGEISVLKLGDVTEFSWNWTPGLPVFLGADGAVTQFPPARASGALFSAQLGVATSPTVINVDRQPSIVLAP